MILSSQLPKITESEVTGSSVVFNSVYGGIPLKECIIDFDEQTAISSLTITVNSISHTINLGESLTEGSLNVLTGILTKADTSTIQLPVYRIDTEHGQNTISVDRGELTVRYIRVR